MSKSFYLGLISGTSMDGADAAVVEFNGDSVANVHGYHQAYPARLKAELETAGDPQSNTGIDPLNVLDHKLGMFFANTATAALQKAGIPASDIAAIGCHGQTVRHCPPDPELNHPPYTMQIGDPNIIAEQTGITTVADFRRRDIAAGGHAAPLVPAFHAGVFRSDHENRVILNLGGIANITVLPNNNATVTGFDTGPSNILMDQWCNKHFGKPYDKNGAIAAGADTIPGLLAVLLKDSYFKQAPPKSTGREYFNLTWLEPFLTDFRDANPESILATLNTFSAHSICDAISAYAPATEHVFACGGGAHNATLMEEMGKLLPNCKFETTAALGINPDYVEAAAFAWLAKRRLEGKPSNLPSVTGASKSVVLGGIYSK